MKTLLQICVLVCMLIFIAGAYAGTYGWEFNDNGNFERWAGNQCTLDIDDGKLVVNIVPDAPKPAVLAPGGAYDTRLCRKTLF